MTIDNARKIRTPVLMAGAAKIGAAAHILLGPNRGSIKMRLLTAMMLLKGKRFASVEQASSFIRSRSYPRPDPAPKRLFSKFHIADEMIGGHLVKVIAPVRAPSSCRIIYLHGGAYVNDMSVHHWAIIEQLVDRTGAEILVPIYPLAPEYDHMPTFPFLLAVYDHLLASTPPEKIVLMGDSAGGGLCVGHAIDLKEKGRALPARLILLAPWMDLTLADPAAKALEARDIMLDVDIVRVFGRWWAGGSDPRAPRLSPLYAELDGLPPIDIHQGSDDILAPDNRSFAGRARNAGIGVDYHEYPGAFHVFPAIPGTVEAKQAFARIEAVIGQIADAPLERPVADQVAMG